MEGIGQERASATATAAASGGRRVWRSRWVLLLLPVALWLVATLFLRGDLGKWNDDYFFLGQFDVAAGEVRTYVLDRRLHFWRPVYRYVATPLITAMFEHDRALHVISATVHALVCLALFGLLRRMGLSWPAAGLGAMFLLVYPAGYEVPLWNTCNFTGVTTAVMLWLTLVYLNWLDGRARLGPAGVVVMMTALGFLAAAINEQPAAAAPALAVLGAGAVWAGRVGVGGRGWRRGLVRAAIPAMGAGAGIATYLAVQLWMHPMPEGHGIGSKIPLADLPQRFKDLYGSVLSDTLLRGVKQDALTHGARALALEPALAGLAAVLVLAGAAVWVRRAARAAPIERTNSERRWLMVLMAFGIAWYLACWLPIARIAYPTSPRLFYAPSAGLAMALAAGLELAVFSRRRMAWRGVAAAGAVVACVVLAVMMVGIQRGYQTRWHADEQQARELVRLVPRPPKRAIFVPVRVIDRPLVGAAGEPNSFTRRFQAPLRSDWAGGWWLQRAYRRDDVFAMQAVGPWEHVPVTAGPATDAIKDERGTVRLLNPVMPPHPRRRVKPLNWDRIVPFEIDAAGRVRVFTKVVVLHPDGTRREVTPRPVKGVAERQGEEWVLEVPWVEQ